MLYRNARWLLSVAVLCGASACHGPPDVSWTPVPQPITAVESTSGASPSGEVRQLFSSRCAPCHGTEGRGDGIAAAALNPHPQNFHDATWQTATSNADIERAIREGGESVHKSPLMPANPDLVDHPEVIAQLRAYVRSFGEQASAMR